MIKVILKLVTFNNTQNILCTLFTKKEEGWQKIARAYQEYRLNFFKRIGQKFSLIRMHFLPPSPTCSQSTHTHLYTNTCTHTQTHTHIHRHTHMHARTHTHRYTQIHTHTHSHIHTHTLAHPSTDAHSSCTTIYQKCL